MIYLSTKLIKTWYNKQLGESKLELYTDLKRHQRYCCTMCYLQIIGRRIAILTYASLGNSHDGAGSIGAYIIWLMDKEGY